MKSKCKRKTEAWRQREREREKSVVFMARLPDCVVFSRKTVFLTTASVTEREHQISWQIVFRIANLHTRRLHVLVWFTKLSSWCGMSSLSRVSLPRIWICFLWSFLLLLVVLCFLFVSVFVGTYHQIYDCLLLYVFSSLYAFFVFRISQSFSEYPWRLCSLLSFSLFNDAARKRIFSFLLPEVSFWKFWIWQLLSSRCC